MKTNTKPVKMSKNLNECCITSFNQFLENKTVFQGQSTFFDILTRHNYFSITPKEKGEYYTKAQQFLQAIENQKPKNKIRHGFYLGNKKLSVVFKAKTMALEDYYKTIQSQEKHLKEILK